MIVGKEGEKLMGQSSPVFTCAVNSAAPSTVQQWNTENWRAWGHGVSVEALISVKKETFGQILSCSQWDEKSSRLIQLERKDLFSLVTGKERESTALGWSSKRSFFFISEAKNGHLRLWGVIYRPLVLTKTQATFLFLRAGQASLLFIPLNSFQ